MRAILERREDFEVVAEVHSDGSMQWLYGWGRGWAGLRRNKRGGTVNDHAQRSRCERDAMAHGEPGREPGDFTESRTPGSPESPEQCHRSHTLRRSTADAEAILRIAVRLFERTEARRRPVQRMSLSASKLHLADATDRQLELFPTGS